MGATLRWIKAFGLLKLKITENWCWCWRKISKQREVIRLFIKHKVGHDYSFFFFFGWIIGTSMVFCILNMIYGVIYDSASTSNAKATSILSHDGWWFPRSRDLVAIQYKCFQVERSKQATVM